VFRRGGGTLVRQIEEGRARKLQGAERKESTLAIWVGMGWRGGSACGPASGGAHGGRRPCASREGSTGAIYRVQRSEDKRGRGLKDELDEEGRNW